MPSAADPKVTSTDGHAPDAEGPAPAEIDPATGQHRSYWILTAEERAKGFVRPVRRTYRHVGKRPMHPTRPLTEEESARYGGEGIVIFEIYPESESGACGRYWTADELRSGCGTTTTMSREIAETYARQPSFYGATFCCRCRTHKPVGADGEFVWHDGTDGDRVGT